MVNDWRAKGYNSLTSQTSQPPIISPVNTNLANATEKLCGTIQDYVQTDII